MKPVIALIEPCYFGVGYLNPIAESEIDRIVVTASEKNPEKYGYEGKYEAILLADIRNADDVLRTLRKSAYFPRLAGIVAGNQFTTDITAQVAEALRLPGISHEAARRGRQKDLAREAYAAGGAPSVRFARISSVAEAIAAAESIGYPVILKPTDSASSQHVYQIGDREKLLWAMQQLQSYQEVGPGFSARKEFLIEEYAEGPEYSVEILVQDGNTLFAEVTEKTTTEPPFFVETCHVFPAPLDVPVRAQLIRAAEKALESLGITQGTHHVELKLTGHGPVIIETNPRPGGDHITTDLVPLATGVNLFEMHLQIARGQRPEPPSVKRRAAAVAFLVADREGRLSSIGGLETLRSLKGMVRFAIEKPAGSPVRPPQNSSDRLGYVIVEAATADQAKALAKQAINLLQIEYES